MCSVESPDGTALAEPWQYRLVASETLIESALFVVFEGGGRKEFCSRSTEHRPFGFSIRSEIVEDDE